MTRRAVIAFAVLASLLVVTAQPAAAADADLEVASKNTTTSDFNGAQQLTNVTVQNGNVVFDGLIETSYSAVESDGDGTASSGTAYLGDTSGDTPLKAEAEIVPNATGTLQNITVAKSGASGSDYGFVVDIYLVKESTDQTYSEGSLIVDDWNPAFSSGGELVAITEPGNASVSANTRYTLEFVTQSTDNDGSYDAINVKLDTSPSTVWTTTNGAGQFKDISDVTVSIARKVSSGQYISANHSAEHLQAAFSDLSLTNTSATVEWQYWTGSAWKVDNSSTFTTDGNKTLDLSASASKWRVNVSFENTVGTTSAKLQSEGLLFQAATPDGSNADPTGNVTSFDGDISLDISDADFATAQGDSIDVVLENNSGTQINSTTISSNGTVTFAYDAVAGKNDLNWSLTDSYGNTQRIDHEFTAPEQIIILNESSPQTKVTESVTVSIESSERVFERTTSDGTVQMTGLDATEEYTIRIESSNYVTRQTYTESLFEQQRVYLLPSSATTVDQQFILDDQTGGSFPPEDTRIKVQRALNVSDQDGKQWQTISSGIFGSVNRHPTTLKDATRYRLVIVNEQSGDTRALGRYLANTNGDVILPVGTVSIKAPAVNESVRADLSTANTSNGPVARISISDPSNSTEDISWVLYNESGANSTKIANGSVSGPIGTYRETVAISDTQGRYRANITLTHDGTQLAFDIYAGGVNPFITQLPVDQRWLSLIGYVGILGVAGFAVIIDSRLAAALATGVATIFTAIGVVAIPVPLLGLAAGTSVLFLVGRDRIQ